MTANTTDIALLSIGCTLLGVLIAKTWQLAVEFTTIRSDMAKGKQDNNNLGEKTKQNELKLFYVAMMLCPDDQPGVRKEILNALVRKLT